MKLLVLAGVLGVPVLSATDSVDIPGGLAAYGIAAPFAAALIWMVREAHKDRDEARAETAAARAEAAAARAEAKQERDASLTRERELNSRFGPMVYDSALLFDKGTARLADAPAEQAERVDRLVEAVQELTRKIQS